MLSGMISCKPPQLRQASLCCLHSSAAPDTLCPFPLCCAVPAPSFPRCCAVPAPSLPRCCAVPAGGGAPGHARHGGAAARETGGRCAGCDCGAPHVSMGCFSASNCINNWFVGASCLCVLPWGFKCSRLLVLRSWETSSVIAVAFLHSWYADFPTPYACPSPSIAGGARPSGGSAPAAETAAAASGGGRAAGTESGGAAAAASGGTGAEGCRHPGSSGCWHPVGGDSCTLAAATAMTALTQCGCA